MVNKKILAVDIDGVLTETTELNDYGRISFEELKTKYFDVKPNKEMIKKVNAASDRYVIVLYTSRNDFFRDITKKWLKKYHVYYDEIIFNKPYYHYIIDDRAINEIP